jgi:hypothetical protein
MSVANVFTLHGIANGSSFLSQISNSRLTAEMNELLGTPAGLPYPTFVANGGMKPTETFDCTQIKTLLDTTNALAGIADLSANNTDLYYKKLQDLGVRVNDATQQHKRVRASLAYLIVERITASHDGEASASCKIGALFDGTNPPFVPAGGLALTGTPSSVEHFTVGPVFANTGSGFVQIPGVQQTTIDFRRAIIELGSDGELYITFCAMADWKPQIGITCTEFVWDTYGMTGVAFTGLSVYLRKKTTTGNLANGTPQHIKFANAVGGLLAVQDVAGGVNDPAMTNVRFTCLGDASNQPLTVNTAIAITT